jgi:predicted glycoside hydrolase/deacetylase ChbG (UPF0249 family)
VTSVILNADDYAMDDGVDAGILALARQGVVTATSAMVLSPFWPAAARPLTDVEVDCGLHLDFTSLFAQAQEAALARPLPKLIAAAYSGRLDRAALRGAVGRQLDRFDAATQAPPVFVDGHQHVHQLPGIREALLASLRERYGEAASAIALRLCLTRRWRGLKAAVIARMGGRSLGRMIAAAGHPKNSDFAGVYGFSPAADLAALWRRWLTDVAGERPLIMCHVAADSAAGWPADEIRAARLNEWKWLGSPAFHDLCTELGIRRAAWRIGG